ncbi:MAG TPA: host attachment protein [Verrucomicrobiae bacterium]|nr:host attachment protein [Verrucomicrobiae bacterium]
MDKLVVLTDLGTFKAFRLEENRTRSTPRLQPVEAYENPDGDDRIGRRLSDQAGQFGMGALSSASVFGQGNGERHNIWLENERRSVKEIAEKMSELLADGEFESCYFAAGNEINLAIIEHLSPQARAKIEKNVHCNLVNAQKDDVLQHFN